MQVERERREDRLEHARVGPFLEPAVAGLIGRVAPWQVLPGRAGAQVPEDVVEHLARISARTAATVRALDWGRDERGNEIPLHVGEFHIPPIATPPTIRYSFLRWLLVK